MTLGLAERINTVLALDPEQRAVEFNSVWHTWSAIKGAMIELERLLSAAGIGEGATVGLILRNRASLLAALLQILVSKRCVVTINPFQRPEKLIADLRSLRVSAVIADSDDWAIAELADAVRELGSLGILAEGREALQVSVHIDADTSRDASAFHEPMPGVGILMLTSGTTGPAKRIQLPFRSFEQSITDAEHYENKGRPVELKLKTSVGVLTTPLVHIGGMYAAVAAIAAARPIAILEKFSVPEIRRVLKAYQPKLIALPPTAIKMILDADVPREELSSLRALRTGSAPLDPALQEKFEDKYGVPLLDAYGATEFAGAVAGWSLKDHQAFSKQKRGSVGRAHPGCALRVVDPATSEPLPAGSAGLLEVKTRQFDPDKWVRTNDLAEIDADGFLFIRGRADDAIVRGGFKVLPREVEAIFRKHPAVKDASVVGLPDARLGAIPVVAIELHDPESALTADELVEFARKELVSYQVPAQALVVKALPRTPSLKVSQHEVRNLFASISSPQAA